MGMSRHSGETLLVVDDVEEIGDASAQLLTASGYQVVSARTEAGAIEASLRTPVQLILMNVSGPQETVAAIGRRIRTRARLPFEVPVVVFGTEEIVDGCEDELDENVYVIHPDNFDMLRNLIARYLKADPPLGTS